MNKNSNSYIITYTTIMVVVVAAVLSFASLSLQGRQQENVRIEKMGDILRSIGEGGDADKVADKAKYITEEYNKYITDSYVVNSKGEVVEGVDAFGLLINLKAEYDKPMEQRELPVFVNRSADGKTRYILPVWGKGLWGPVWGYLALDANWDTVSGVVFDHKGETPGLGAEIAGKAFQDQFPGKHIFNGEGQLVSIALLKGGMAKDDPYAVDAISGGTLTSIGVENMLKDGLEGYLAYIEKQRGNAPAAAAEAQPAADSVAVPGADTVAVTAADTLTTKQ